jgi:hypothetical protein
LGLALGDKIFVDITRYEFDVSMKRLENEINLVTGNSNNNDKKNNNNLNDYFNNLNELSSSSNLESKYRIIIQTKNGFENNSFFNIRLYGLEYKTIEKKIFIPESETLFMFNLKSYFIGQLIGLSIRIDDGNYLYKCV